jgi:hypothetical protein
MIATYSEYIRRFFRKSGLDGKQCPGEHHFVSVFLVPLLYSINSVVPDYVNPDGTKRLIGDVIYFKDGAHHYGIEVKLGTVRLTKEEFNSWIVAEVENKHPNVFIGVGRAGLLVLTWKEFRKLYVGAVRAKEPSWEPKRITGGYGPSKSVDVLCRSGVGGANFGYSAEPSTSASEQARLVAVLSALLPQRLA